MKFIPLREAKAKLSEVIRDTEKQDIIITCWGKPKVLMQKLGEEDIEDYVISHSEKIRESIAEAWEAYKRGEIISLDEIKRGEGEMSKVKEDV